MGMRIYITHPPKTPRRPPYIAEPGPISSLFIAPSPALVGVVCVAPLGKLSWLGIPSYLLLSFFYIIAVNPLRTFVTPPRFPLFLSTEV